jgi:hypothetical protein
MKWNGKYGRVEVLMKSTTDRPERSVVELFCVYMKQCRQDTDGVPENCKNTAPRMLIGQAMQIQSTSKDIKIFAHTGNLYSSQAARAVWRRNQPLSGLLQLVLVLRFRECRVYRSSDQDRRRLRSNRAPAVRFC